MRVRLDTGTGDGVVNPWPVRRRWLQRQPLDARATAPGRPLMLR
jgi:hypothetical protein